jgi:amino acid adenylation domain-containing protein
MLAEQGCGVGERICLLMPKSPMAIACILGIYKAGGVYVPLDPASPPARLASILRSCDARWLLAGGTVTSNLLSLKALGGMRRSLAVGWMDPEPDAHEEIGPVFSYRDVIESPATPWPRRRRRSEQAAHILFTSGSTGMPKGVVISHGNVIAFVEWAVKYFRMNVTDRVSGHSPLHFDLSVFDIFGAFSSGAELHLVPEECKILPNKLAGWIREAALTQWFSVPSALNYIAKFGVIEPGDFPALRRVMWCGEVMPTPSLIQWMKRLPHVSFTNLYGPTEATIASSYYTVPVCPTSETEEIPIGTACGGEELMVLNKELKPVTEGAIGDLYIRGAGLSSGYWRNPDETRNAFLKGPDGKRLYRTGDLARYGTDGLVYFVGREDAQVKSRGYRIELGEIESALNTIPDLFESAVVAVASDDFDGVKICCSYVPIQGRNVTPTNLRERLRQLLPDYMIPGLWQAWEELPRNQSGKVNRKYLQEYWTHDEAASA